MRDINALDDVNLKSKSDALDHLLNGPAEELSNQILMTLSLGIVKGAMPIDVAAAVPIAVHMLTNRLEKTQALAVYITMTAFMDILLKQIEARTE